ARICVCPRSRPTPAIRILCADEHNVLGRGSESGVSHLACGFARRGHSESLPRPLVFAAARVAHATMSKAARLQMICCRLTKIRSGPSLSGLVRSMKGPSKRVHRRRPGPDPFVVLEVHVRLAPRQRTEFLRPSA